MAAKFEHIFSCIDDNFFVPVRDARGYAIRQPLKIIKYAQRRFDRLTKIHCNSNVEEELVADLNNYGESHQ